MPVSLILPCFHPPQGWAEHIVNRFEEFCQAVGEKVELVLVIDGDGSEEIASGAVILKASVPGVQIVRYEVNRGKGYAIRQGVQAAKGDLILYTDVDFPYTTASMVSVYKELAQGRADVAIGVKDAAYYSHVPPVRKAISKVLRFMIRVFLSMPVTDTQCGLKGFKKEVAPLFLSTTINRYLFDLEFVKYCFRAKKYRVSPVPVGLTEQVKFRSMDYRILLPELLNFIRLLFR